MCPLKCTWVPKVQRLFISSYLGQTISVINEVLVGIAGTLVCHCDSTGSRWHFINSTPLTSRTTKRVEQNTRAPPAAPSLPVDYTTYPAAGVCTATRAPYCIFNQDRRLVIIPITSLSLSIYSFLLPLLSWGCLGRGRGGVAVRGAERIHLKFAHLAVVRDMDSDSTQLAQSPPLSSLIFSRGI